MKKLTKAGIGLGAVAAVTAASALVVFAWGPSGRKTFTMEKPADYVTFNSITNNVIGDERYFVSASKWTGSAKDNYFSDTTYVEDGKEYVVRMYVHNNAGANLGLVAENVKALLEKQGKSERFEPVEKVLNFPKITVIEQDPPPSAAIRGIIILVRKPDSPT